MGWSEWKKFGSYSKYHYDAGNEMASNDVTVPKDCTSGILLVIIYHTATNFRINNKTGIASKTALFENIGNQYIGNFKKGYKQCKQCGKKIKNTIKEKIKEKIKDLMESQQE